ncbi:MAG: UDP-N-acetylglucosamine 1-carboxyvinyltransferase [Anaerolineaceae bacterium]|nr:UDP-N-acetylglucosamine 1-carboxyvinyltransferase [Anaerolineaceae bacterium]
MRIHVEGRQALNGNWRPSGNPNAALALLAAALLGEQPVVLHNMPRTASTLQQIELASWLGADIKFDQGSMLRVETRQLSRRTLDQEALDHAGAILMVAPLLLRCGHIRLEIETPRSRLLTHLDALRDLGQDVLFLHGAVEIRAVPWRKREILLGNASVTATGIVLMLAATLGEETVIHNAASEPHVQELCRLLEAMGASVKGQGSNLLHVVGCGSPAGAESSIGPNHIEVASIAAIAALCGGRVTLNGSRERDLRMVARVFDQFGIHLELETDTVFVPRHEHLTVRDRAGDVDLRVDSAIWPGFPSDLIAIATVIASQARGTTLIHEKLFPNRLLFVDRLKAMGAQIVLCDPHRAIVVGPATLYGSYMATPDIRAGLGMLAAALVAEGPSTIDNAQAIEHHFGAVIDRLKALGAKISVE